MRDEMYVSSRKKQNTIKEIKKVKHEWAVDQKMILSAKLNEMNVKNDLIQRGKDILKVEFKAPNHLMILIPAKMNSPDDDDFIDMFSVPTPVSPLLPTPSHEPSQDVIYDSLPTMEQSTVPESPLKDLLPVDSKLPVVSRPPEVSALPLVKKKRRNEERRNEKRRNEERRNEERRPRDPRLYRRPDFRPPFRRPDFKLRVFRRSAYAQQLMPASLENT
ncbi:hypothetical protein TNCV_705971 [Trichonephila clavipes]|nr:hypothetical protein TNCV_705971 [Trichonephila clavipes]